MEDFAFTKIENLGEEEKILTETALAIFSQMITKHQTEFDKQAEAAFSAAKQFLEVKERVIKNLNNENR